MDQIQSLGDVLAMLRRRRIVIALIALPIIAAAVLFARMQPEAYETAAVLQIESPTVEDNPDRSAIPSTTAGQRVQLIEQRLMVRENLATIIERHGLFRDWGGLSENDKIALLREAVRIQSVTAANSGFGTEPMTALIISARLPSPDQAMAVANDLARGVLDQSASAQAERIRQTVEFFQREEARVGTEIAALEAQITAFKKENVDALPEALSNLRTELGDLLTVMRGQDQSLLELQRERAGLQQETPIRAVALRRIDEIASQIDSIAAQRPALDARRAEIESAINRGPSVETELNIFDRRLQQLQDRYNVISRRLAEAETTQRLELNQQAGRFAMLEPAILPDRPVGSSARKIVVLGGAAGLFLAVAVAFLLEAMNPVVRTSAQMLRQLDLRPVIAIPHLETQAERRRRNMMRIGGMILLAVIILVAMGITSV